MQNSSFFTHQLGSPGLGYCCLFLLQNQHSVSNKSSFLIGKSFIWSKKRAESPACVIALGALRVESRALRLAVTVATHTESPQKLRRLDLWNTKFIILNTKFIVLNTKFIFLNAKFIISNKIFTPSSRYAPENSAAEFYYILRTKIMIFNTNSSFIIQNPSF